MQLFLQFVCFIAVMILHLNFIPIIAKDNFYWDNFAFKALLNANWTLLKMLLEKNRKITSEKVQILLRLNSSLRSDVKQEKVCAFIICFLLF